MDLKFFITGRSHLNLSILYFLMIAVALGEPYKAGLSTGVHTSLKI